MQLVAVLLAAVLLFAWIGTLPGLHGDEAWAILIARGIAAGERPLVGMSSYSGALYPYLLAPVLAWAGWTPLALRAFAAACNLAALGFALAALRRAEASLAARRWMALLLATSPIYVVLSRFAVEVTALTPLLSAIALWLLAGGRSPHRLFLAGLAFGIAGYNHAMALAMPAALALIALAFYRRSSPGPAVLLPLAAGFLLGFAPRILTAFFLPVELRGGGSPAEDLLYLPWAFFRAVDGSLLYRLVTGEEWLRVVPYAVLAFGGLAVLRCREAGVQLERRDVALAALVFGLAVGMTFASPGLAPRYFLLPGLLFPILLVRLAAALFAGRQARAAHAILGATLALNLAYLAIDYFAAFRKAGGGFAEVPIGKRAIETSHEFVPTDTLYRQLVGRGVEEVVADRFIGWPLMVHDLGARRLRVTIAEFQRPALAASRAAVLAYAARTPRDGRIIDLAGAAEVEVAGMRFRRDRSYDPRFAVFSTR